MHDEIPAHPVCGLMPDHTEEEVSQLFASIRRYGLLNPIVLHDGLVVDGVLRYDICIDLGMELRFVALAAGISPWEYAFAVNATRYRCEEQRIAIYFRILKAQGLLPDLQLSARRPRH